MKNIILDCDGAADDILALLLILSSPEELRLLGVTTVDGSVSVQQAARNVNATLTKAGRSGVPVHMGASGPLKGEDKGNDDAYGEDGLNGVIWSNVWMPREEGADEFLIRKLEEVNSAITLVATGPLTNIARLFAARPDLIDGKVEELVIMGGSLGVHDPHTGKTRHGNMTPHAEFNAHKDAPAFAQVLNMAERINLKTTVFTMSGIQGRNQATKPGVVITPERQEMLAEISPDLAKIAMTPAWLDMGKFGAKGAFSFDPNTVLYLLHPNLYDIKDEQTFSVSTGGERAGRTYIGDKAGSSIRVLKSVKNPEAVVQHMATHFRTVFAHKPL